MAAKLEEKARVEKEMAAARAEWEVLEKTKRKREELLGRLQKTAGTITGGEKMMAGMPTLPPAGEVEKKLAELTQESAALEKRIREAGATASEESVKAGRVAEQIRGERGRAERMIRRGLYLLCCPVKG